MRQDRIYSPAFFLLENLKYVLQKGSNWGHISFEDTIKRCVPGLRFEFFVNFSFKLFFLKKENTPLAKLYANRRSNNSVYFNLCEVNVIQNNALDLIFRCLASFNNAFQIKGVIRILQIVEIKDATWRGKDCSMPNTRIINLNLNPGC